jgi:hypothetical protein
MAATTEPSDQRADEVETVLMLLEAGIPLTLLLDLATPIHSFDVYATEAGVADWLVAGVA